MHEDFDIASGMRKLTCMTRGQLPLCEDRQPHHTLFQLLKGK